jgi:hypothetical protein
LVLSISTITGLAGQYYIKSQEPGTGKREVHTLRLDLYITTNIEMKPFTAFCLTILLFASCLLPEVSKPITAMKYKKTGSIQVLDPMMANLVDTSFGIEVLAEGFDWSEGPLWIEQGNYLLFSDIPPNKIMKWSEEKGLEEYLHPSGFQWIDPGFGWKTCNVPAWRPEDGTDGCNTG